MVEEDSSSIQSILLLGVSAFVAVFIAFDILRYFAPTLFYYREAAARDHRWNDYDNSPLVALPRPSHLPLGWIRSTLAYREEDTVRTHGLDVAMYLRFLATQAKLFATLSIFTAIALYPTYITGPNRKLPPEHVHFVRGVEIVSLANVGEKSSRLWITLVSEIVVVAIILFYLYIDIRTYTEYRRHYRADTKRNPSNYAVIVQDIPYNSCTNAEVFELMDSVFPGEVKAVHLIRDAESLHDLKQRYLVAISRRQRAELDSGWYHDSGSKPPSSEEQNAGSSSRKNRIRSTNKTLASCLEEEQKLRSDILAKEDNIDDSAPLTASAIVVFSSLKPATFAATAPIWSLSSEWRMSRAAEPRAMNWNRLDITSWTTRMRKYISFAALTGLALCWTVPAGFIQALGNFGELATMFPRNAGIRDLNPKLVSFLESTLPPLLLFLALLVIPLIITFVISFERIHSLVLVESKIRNFLHLFYTMSNFVYVVVIGSVLKKLRAIVDNPNTIISLLSTSVPEQATFLMKYVLINAFLGSSFGMLNLGRLVLRPILMFRSRTTREIRNADGIFVSYPFARMYALCSVIALIGYVYSTIAPLICVVACLYFCIAYITTKHVLLYSHRPLFEGGGYLFRDSWVHLLMGLYIHQLSMIGIFSLKRALPQAICASLSFVFSIWFTLYCRKRFFIRIKHGALVDHCVTGKEQTTQDRIPSHFPDLYIHPGLRSLTTLENMEACETEIDASP